MHLVQPVVTPTKGHMRRHYNLIR